jgi:hypothetical protein
LDKTVRSLRVATGMFQAEAAKAIFDRDATVLLSVPHSDGSATTLAVKSTDATHVEFHQAYYRLLPRKG